jgi:hypothetical protein
VESASSEVCIASFSVESHDCYFRLTLIPRAFQHSHQPLTRAHPCLYPSRAEHSCVRIERGELLDVSQLKRGGPPFFERRPNEAELGSSLSLSVDDIRRLQASLLRSFSPQLLFVNPISKIQQSKTASTFPLRQRKALFEHPVHESRGSIWRNLLLQDS